MQQPGQCFLHVYDVTNAADERVNTAISRFNAVARYVSLGGVYHGAIEVYGDEWSYGYTLRATGVYKCDPKDNPMYTYRETIPLGITPLSKPKVEQLLEELKSDWKGKAYDTTTRNCNHFCEEFARKLGLPPLPGWLNRLAFGAETVANASAYTTEQAKNVRESGAAWWRWAADQWNPQRPKQPPQDTPK